MTTETTSRAADDRPLAWRAWPARFIVCESGSSWAVGLRREAGAWPLRIHETRSLDECRQLLEGGQSASAARWLKWRSVDEWPQLLQGYPASFLVVELTRAGLEGLLGFLACIGRDYPWARLAVVAPRELAAAEWLMREAGAVHFVTSPRQLAGLVCTARRHLEAVPRPRLSPAEEIWAGLPWSGARAK
jgi:hypothetical protein